MLSICTWVHGPTDQRYRNFHLIYSRLRASPIPRKWGCLSHSIAVAPARRGTSEAERLVCLHLGSSVCSPAVLLCSSISPDWSHSAIPRLCPSLKDPETCHLLRLQWSLRGKRHRHGRGSLPKKNTIRILTEEIGIWGEHTVCEVEALVSCCKSSGQEIQPVSWEPSSLIAEVMP